MCFDLKAVSVEVVMSMASHGGFTPAFHAADHDAVAHGPAYQAYQILHVAFIVAPILAGIDKFFHVLTDWDMYLAPFFADRIFHGHGHQFMLAAGVVEIIVGLGVAVMPRLFGWIVALWMWCIIINLFVARGFYDVALRDFGLSLAAIALARLAMVYAHHHHATVTTTTTTPTT